jgi:ABC-type nickel/cobalt efflux system permease component RcnA
MMLSDVLSGDPTFRLLQIALLLIAVLAVFLVFYTLRDILLRSRSFFFQIISILLVSCLPIVGFLLYVLIRPTRTLREREVDRALGSLLTDMDIIAKKIMPAEKIAKKKV